MASAKKCDICGRLYESPMCNDAVNIHIDCGPYGDICVDLCDSCYNRLCNFVKPALPKDYSTERRK